MTGKSLFSRAVVFETQKWGRFEWRYGSKEERKQWMADNLLILETVLEDSNGVRVKVAQMVRHEECRTPGTGKRSAGNGGLLQMDLGALKGSPELEEVVVVATCLVMLKKEIDRLRMVQFMVIAGAASGGA